MPRPARSPALSGSSESGRGASAAPARFVGEELDQSGAAPSPPVPAARPSLTPPPEVVAQMGTAPDAPLPDPAPTGGGVMPPAEATVVLPPGGGRGGIGTRLVCTEGPYAGQSFPLSHAPTTVGRATDRDIALPADTSVSRSHARIVYEGGRHMVSDAGSSNGTFVNGLLVAGQQPLNAGDLLQLGGTVLRYE